MTQFAKLDDGSWGVRGPVHEIKPGHPVTVRKRDGVVKVVVVSRIIHERDGIVIAAMNGSAGPEPKKHEPRARVHTYRFPGDDREYFRNVRGRCIDAPCCGCCNI